MESSFGSFSLFGRDYIENKKMVLLKQRDFFIIVSKMFYSLQGNGIDECH